MKYTTERFVQENLKEIFQVINSKTINNSELFITHSFITEHPKDEELNQEQIRRIVKAIQKMLLTELHIHERGVEEELRQVLPLLKDKGLFQGYASQNISYLISACEKI